MSGYTPLQMGVAFWRLTPAQRLALRVHVLRDNPPRDRFAALVIEGICLNLLRALMLTDRDANSQAKAGA